MGAVSHPIKVQQKSKLAPWLKKPKQAIENQKEKQRVKTLQTETRLKHVFHFECLCSLLLALVSHCLVCFFNHDARFGLLLLFAAFRCSFLLFLVFHGS